MLAGKQEKMLRSELFFSKKDINYTKIQVNLPFLLSAKVAERKPVPIRDMFQNGCT